MRGLALVTLTLLSSSSSTTSSKRRRIRELKLDDSHSQLNYYLEQLNLLLPNMHLQWLNNANAKIALIYINPVNGKYQVLAQASTQQQMIENAAVLVRVLKRAHANRFKKYQEKLEKEKEEK